MFILQTIPDRNELSFELLSGPGWTLRLLRPILSFPWGIQSGLQIVQNQGWVGICRQHPRMLHWIHYESIHPRTKENKYTQKLAL